MRVSLLIPEDQNATEGKNRNAKAMDFSENDSWSESQTESTQEIEKANVAMINVAAQKLLNDRMEIKEINLAAFHASNSLQIHPGG